MQKGMNGMKKQRWVLLLAAVLTAFLLCGCSQYDGQYDDEAFLSDSANHYAAIQWWGNIQKDGSYALKVGSFSGVKTLGSFTVEEDQTLCEVQSTLTGTKGEAKLLVLNTGDETLAAQWPLGSQDPMSVTLPAGKYDLRIAGKSAGFEGQVSLSLNGEVASWDDLLEAIQKKIEETTEGDLQETFRRAADSLQQTFGDGQNAA